ncbi:MAG: NAD(P)/FAD-dependent oxidoreductase [Acidobacteria bacterium]|nr:NAD(P)/FAD-dependent oxidoreductase [Acidobacteriota bacterium]
MSKNIAIVGSGFLGMTLALRLADSGHKVTLYEAANEIGGLASAWSIGDVVWDKHYHVTLASDSDTRKIVDELGLGDQFKWVETKTGFYTGGKLYSMSDTLEFLRFPPLGLVGKLRLGATIFYASRVKDWKKLEKVSVEQWLTRLSGKTTFEKIWKPLLIAKLGDAYQETSAAFIWATIQRMYAARNSGLKKEMFGYVRGGYARVLERFSEVLLKKGVEIRLNARVESVNRAPNSKIRVTTAEARRHKDIKPSVLKRRTKYATFKAAAAVTAGFSGAFLTEPDLNPGKLVTFPRTEAGEIFDHVILTCPSNIAAEMIPELTRLEKNDLASVRYQGIVCASVLTKKPLSTFYVTNITDDAPFTGIIEMSALVDKRDLGGNSLIYLPKYAAPDDEMFARGDAEIEELFLGSLERMYPQFTRKDVVEFKVSRVRQVFPLPVLNYSAGLPSMKTSIDGVHVVNSSHIVNGTLNVNETVALAERFFEGMTI